jgi:hypothetical protein
VHVTVVSLTPLHITAVSMPPLCMPRWCQRYRFAFHSGVNDTTVHITALSMTPLCNQLCWMFFANDPEHGLTLLCMSQRCQWHSCDMHSGIITPLWHAKQCQWHRCDMQSSVNDSAVQIWYRCDFGLHIRSALATFKVNIYRKIYIGKLSYTVSITFTHKIWGLTKDRFFSQRCPWHRWFHSRFSWRIRSNVYQEPRGSCLMKKKRDQSLVSGSLETRLSEF